MLLFEEFQGVFISYRKKDQPVDTEETHAQMMSDTKLQRDLLFLF